MYESRLRLYLLPQLDRILLAALTIGDVRAAFLAITRQHQALGAPRYATTLHSIRCTLRAALNAAIREGLMIDNPARWIELPADGRPHAVVWTRARVAAWKAGGARPTVAVWTAADTARFLAAIEGDELRPMLYLVALRGLRRGEADGVCWPDLDLDEATLTISRTLQEHVRRPVLLRPKTAGPEGHPGHARSRQHRAHRRHLHRRAARSRPPDRGGHRRPADVRRAKPTRQGRRTTPASGRNGQTHHGLTTDSRRGGT
jgi:hypothetical protein